MVPSLAVQAAPRINGLLGGAGLPTAMPAGAGWRRCSIRASVSL